MDHDQRFKALIREFFADFMRLFFPKWAEFLDLDSTQWVEKEVLPNPPDGSRHVLDLVAQLRQREAEGEDWFVLVHIEIESPDKTTVIKPRLPSYYVHLREARGLPVLPIVLYLRVGMEGIGVDEVVETIGDFEVLRLRYLYVGLPSLNAAEYVQGSSWLGIAFSSLMNAPSKLRPALGAAAFQRLSEESMTEYQRFLLMDCIQAYLPLDAEGRAEYERIINTEPYSKVKAMNKTSYDLGMEQGIEEGAKRTLRTMATALLESRFQSVPAEFQQKIQHLSSSTLQALVLKIPAAQTIEDVFADANP